MDYTVSNSLLSSKVVERVVLFYLLVSYYLNRYIESITNTFRKVLSYINKNTIARLRKNPDIQERGSLYKYRCICMALRGHVNRLSHEESLVLRRVLGKWLREGKRESSGSETEQE
jgi:predicted SprT family Zn-dependent metalloprotease